MADTPDAPASSRSADFLRHYLRHAVLVNPRPETDSPAGFRKWQPRAKASGLFANGCRLFTRSNVFFLLSPSSPPCKMRSSWVNCLEIVFGVYRFSMFMLYLDWPGNRPIIFVFKCWARAQSAPTKSPNSSAQLNRAIDSPPPPDCPGLIMGFRERLFASLAHYALSPSFGSKKSVFACLLSPRRPPVP
jgi:hypothetical protein